MTEREPAAELRRNVLIHDDHGFKGEWVAVPREDFDAIGYALRAVQPGPDVEGLRDAEHDAILGATAEAARDAVADSTRRLIIAFRRFCVGEFGRAPTEDDFRQMLALAATDKPSPEDGRRA